MLTAAVISLHFWIFRSCCILIKQFWPCTRSTAEVTKGGLKSYGNSFEMPRYLITGWIKLLNSTKVKNKQQNNMAAQGCSLPQKRKIRKPPISERAPVPGGPASRSAPRLGQALAGGARLAGTTYAARHARRRTSHNFWRNFSYICEIGLKVSSKLTKENIVENPRLK